MGDRLTELIRGKAQATLREGWTCQIAGREILCLPETPSTNHVALHLGRQGAPEGALVLADYQTAGRGRLGRAWVAPPGSSLLFSILLRPPLERPRFQPIMAVALGVRRGLEAGLGLLAALKWPNDILLDGRKTGGLLAEGEVLEGFRSFVVVGVGLNVNFDPADVAGIPCEATSIARQYGRQVDRCDLLRRILQSIDEEYAWFRQGQSPHARWCQALSTLGCEVRVELPGETVRGRAERADEDGALWVREAGGGLRRILAGDVVHLRPGA